MEKRRLTLSSIKQSRCNEIRSLLFIVSFSLFLQGCESTHDQSSQGEFGEKIKIERIDVSQGGVIGDYNFYQKYPEFMDTAVNAVGTISIYKNGEFISSGVGLHIKEVNANYEFILTAGHIIYDTVSKEKKGDTIRFKHSPSNQDIIHQKITKTPANFDGDFFTKDWALVPVNPQENGLPFEVDLRSNFFRPNDNMSQEYDGYFLSISSTIGNDNSEIVRFVNKSNNLYKKAGKAGAAYSDLDAFRGMSGSPVFFISGQKMHLIGILSSRSLVKNCEDIQRVKECANTISLLPVRKKKNDSF